MCIFELHLFFVSFAVLTINIVILVWHLGMSVDRCEAHEMSNTLCMRQQYAKRRLVSEGHVKLVKVKIGLIDE